MRSHNATFWPDEGNVSPTTLQLNAEGVPGEGPGDLAMRSRL